MAIEIQQTSSKRKSLKSRRVKAHQRLFVRKEVVAPDPDSVAMNRIINNIKKEMRNND